MCPLRCKSPGEAMAFHGIIWGWDEMGNPETNGPSMTGFVAKKKNRG